MTILPDSSMKRLDFFSTHIAAWKEDPAAIGLTMDEVDAIEALVDSGTQKWRLMLAARSNAMSTTQAFHLEIESLSELGAEAIARIKLFSASTDDPSVLTKARLPQPKKRRRKALPPEPPTDLRAHLNANGCVELSWKGTTARGQYFVIARRIDWPDEAGNYSGGPGGFSMINAVADKRFVDSEVPVGSARIAYQISAARGRETAQPVEINVQMGRSGSCRSGAERLRHRAA